VFPPDEPTDYEYPPALVLDTLVVCYDTGWLDAELCGMTPVRFRPFAEHIVCSVGLATLPNRSVDRSPARRAPASSHGHRQTRTSTRSAVTVRRAIDERDGEY
jgi:hypothetical protein